MCSGGRETRDSVLSAQLSCLIDRPVLTRRSRTRRAGRGAIDRRWRGREYRGPVSDHRRGLGRASGNDRGNGDRRHNLDKERG